MSLTAIDVASAVVSGTTLQIPRILAAKVALTANDTLGFAFTNVGSMARFVQLASQDGTWYWHDIDAQTTANSRAVPINQPYEFQIPPNGVINLYCRAASGTVNVVASVER